MVTIGELLKGNTQVLHSGYELGFQIYTSFIKTLTNNYFIYNFINVSVDFIILYFVIKRFSKYPISLTYFFNYNS